MPPQLKEIMIRLQSENKHLKEQLERELARATEDKGDLNDQIEVLTNEKQLLSDKVSELEQKVLSGTSDGAINTEEIQELQDRLQKAKEDVTNRKNQINELESSLNETKSKTEEFDALLKQKDEDIKVCSNLLARFNLIVLVVKP
jgi:chromosome segregation ATPase